MPNKKLLEKLGLDVNTNLIGKIELLSFDENATTILFLFDEHHENLNDCINNNILNAIELIENGNVNIVGVESLAGGESWDCENQIYSDDYQNKKLDDVFAEKYKSSCTKFADNLALYSKDVIFGVECFGMMHSIVEDISLGKYIDVISHPLNIERSKHFVKTVVNNYPLKKGNMIINCGSNHNNHIAKWVKSGEIDQLIEMKINYVRINTMI